MLQIASVVTLFPGPNFQPTKVLAQRIAYQRRSVALATAHSLIGGLKELLVKDNLDDFHMWSILHNIFHTKSGFDSQRLLHYRRLVSLNPASVHFF